MIAYIGSEKPAKIVTKIKKNILLVFQSKDKCIISGTGPTEIIARKPKIDAAKELIIMTNYNQ